MGSRVGDVCVIDGGSIGSVVGDVCAVSNGEGVCAKKVLMGDALGGIDCRGESVRRGTVNLGGAFEYFEPLD
jgi:hypothetical protein